MSAEEKISYRWDDDAPLGMLPNGELNVVQKADDPPDERIFRDTADATPKTLYIRRDVINKDELLSWAREVGLEAFGKLVDDLHVTIGAFPQSTGVFEYMEDWNSNDEGQVIIPPGGMRMLDRLGIGGSVAALLFTSERLARRHCQVKQAMECNWEWEYYQPHITFVYGPDNQSIDFEALRKIEPYRGEIVLGPEIWEETKTDEEIAKYKSEA